MKDVNRRTFLLSAAAAAGASLSAQSSNPNQRGFMLNPRIATADIRALGDLNVNLVRYPFNASGLENYWTPSQYRSWVLGEATVLESYLSTFKDCRIKVIPEIHTFPKAAATGHRLIHETVWANEFVAIWDQLAKKFANNNTIYAFDLLNEPEYPDQDHPAWEALATRAIDKIRATDDDRIVIFEPKRAEPSRFKTLKRLMPRKVLYSLHMYDPMNFTHQGLSTYPAGISYPGVNAKGTKIDKSYLRAALLPAKQFADENQVGIYVGEFSFNQYSPGSSAYNYLRDVINIFEEFQWRWTYHAFREAPYWNAEANNGGQSLTLLRSYFSRNP